MYLRELESTLQIAIIVGFVISFIVPTYIKYYVKRNFFKEKDVRFLKLYGIDALSTFLFLLFSILGAIILSIFMSYNILLPILAFLLAYFIIDKKWYEKQGIDSSSMFKVTFFSKLIVIVFCYFFAYMCLIPRWY